MDRQGSNFYIYHHRRKSDGVIFYVGKGCGNRAWSKNNRNIHWHRTVKKHGFVVSIVSTGLSFDESNFREVALISHLGRRDLGMGPLVNMTDGGDGRSNYTFRAESKQRIADAARQWRMNPEQAQRHRGALRGRVVSESTRQKISIANLGRKRSPDVVAGMVARMTGRRPSEETRRKMSEAHSGERSHLFGRVLTQSEKENISAKLKDFYSKNPPTMLGKTHDAQARAKISAARSKRVICSNGMAFDSAKAAAEWCRTLGHSKASRTSICNCCNGKIKKSYGLVWAFA